MRIGETFFILIVLSAAALWIAAAFRSYQHLSFRGFLFYLIHLGLALGLIAILWVFLVYPTLDCIGRLCGLENVILWGIIGSIIMIVWPLILLSFYKRKSTTELKKTKNQEDVLDDLG
jgi:ethanolamine transporter EutH